MKTKRFNWAYIIIGIVGLLLASCAVDDGDDSIMDLQNGPYEAGKVSVYEGVWFADNNVARLDTAEMQVYGNYLRFSRVPFIHSLELKKYSGGVIGDGAVSDNEGQEDNAVYHFSFNSWAGQLLALSLTGSSDEGLFYSLYANPVGAAGGIDFELNTFPDLLQLSLDTRESNAVYDVKSDQWGVFLHYDYAILEDRKVKCAYVGELNLGYKFITTKRLK